MNSKVSYLRVLIGVLVLLMAAPPGIMAQDSGAGATFRQEELDQMLAPIALYSDSLLGQILVAATYPDQVREADQWVKQNNNLQGDALNAAVDGSQWDLSVKALVPFPQVLSMMSDKIDWTQRMGDAFMAQQGDVMDSIQRLRSKAHAQGNLKSTEQQTVVVRGESIEIEPADPRVVYVPTYNPAVIYGPWWYASYPPFTYNPYYPGYLYDPYYAGAGFITAGLFGFAAGIAVGSYWNSGWGRWDWGGRNINVNVNRTVNINSNSTGGGAVTTSSFQRGSPSTGGAAVGRTGSSVTSGRAVSTTGAGRSTSSGAAAVGRTGSSVTSGRAASTTGTRPTAASVQQGLQQRGSNAQTRQGTSTGQGSQTRVGAAGGQSSRGGTTGRSSGQVGSSMSSTRSHGQMGSATSSARSHGQMGSSMSSTRSQGQRGGAMSSGRSGGSSPRGGGSSGGGKPPGGGGGKPTGGAGSHAKTQ